QVGGGFAAKPGSISSSFSPRRRRRLHSVAASAHGRRSPAGTGIWGTGHGRDGQGGLRLVGAWRDGHRQVLHRRVLKRRVLRRWVLKRWALKRWALNRQVLNCWALNRYWAPNRWALSGRQAGARLIECDAVVPSRSRCPSGAPGLEDPA